jgi:hypothetical protein
MQGDVKAAYTVADAALIPYRTRIKGLFFAVATAGTDPVVIYDNATTGAGTVLLTIGTTATGGINVYIPPEGILATNGVYVDTGDADSVTVFYG